MSGTLGGDAPAPFAVGSMNPALTNTYMQQQVGTANVREDLADIVYMIDPDETPMISAISTVDCEAVQTDWTVQQLSAADVNAQPEGFRYAPQPALKPDRWSNICQIMVRAVTVSNTMIASNTVGGNEFDRQSLNKGKEVRRDLELCFTGKSLKSLADPRHMSGIQTWITNGSMGAGGNLVATGNGTAAPVSGTARDTTLDMVNQGLQQAYQQGGNPTLAIMSPSLKRVFSSLAQGGTGNPIVAQNIVQATEAKEMTIVGAVGIYLSDFGRLQLAPDRFMPSNTMLILDVDYVENAPLTGRDMIQEEYARTGDARDGAMVYEGTLRPTAPKAHVLIGDLNETLAP
jgi:hypothetical protein